MRSEGYRLESPCSIGQSGIPGLHQRSVGRKASPSSQKESYEGGLDAKVETELEHRGRDEEEWRHDEGYGRYNLGGVKKDGGSGKGRYRQSQDKQRVFDIAKGKIGGF